MQLYNPLSCSGFIEESAAKVSIQFGECAQARLGFVLIFFINALVRKWGGEEIGIEYNFWLGFAGGFIGYLLPLIFIGKMGISLVIGIAAMLAMGYGSDYIFGGGDSYE